MPAMICDLPTPGGPHSITGVCVPETALKNSRSRICWMCVGRMAGNATRRSDVTLSLRGIPAMKFCSSCGAPVTLKIPPGDTLSRHVCDACQTVHYQNPRLVVGCIVEWDDRILLCRRGIEPRHGMWTVPAGYMENGET